MNRPLRACTPWRAVFGIATLFAAGLGLALAQPYPPRTIRIIVPWTPGGVSDVLARAVGNALAAAHGQTAVIENRPGAAGTIGAGIAARAAPDGYSLLVTDVPTLAISASLYATLSYDAVSDFEPVAMLAGSPMMLAVAPSLGVRNIGDLIQLARARPQAVAYASSGTGSITHLGMVRLERAAGIELLHVPYNGTQPAIASLLAGDTMLAFGTASAVVPHSRTGKLVLIGSSFARPFSQLPEVPPLADTLPGFDMGFYTALMVPARTPKEIVMQLRSEAMAALATPAVRAVLAASGAEPGAMTPAQMRGYLASEVAIWRDVIGRLGLRAKP